MNTYWGGALAAPAAGCLVFGDDAERLLKHLDYDAILLAIGLAIHVLTRPFETIFLALSVILFFIPQHRQLRPLLKTASIAALIVLPALGLIALHDKRVTASWTTLPYALLPLSVWCAIYVRFSAESGAAS